MSAALQKVRDPGSAQARIWAQKDPDPDKPPPDLPEDRGIVTDSGRYLIRKSPYPYARPPITCLSLADFYEGERALILKAILHSAWTNPGDYVSGAQALPRYRSDARQFYASAGFDSFTIELLTAKLVENPLE